MENKTEIMMPPTRVKTALIVGVCSIGLMSLPAFAETTYSEQYYECLGNIDDGAVRNSQLGNCVENELERQDVVLNREYQLLRESFSEDQKSALLQAQRAWLAFRENWCQLEKVTDYAPGGELNYKLCMMSRTAEQIDLLVSLQP